MHTQKCRSRFLSSIAFRADGTFVKEAVHARETLEELTSFGDGGRFEDGVSLMVPVTASAGYSSR